jgi:hypothetical protein
MRSRNSLILVGVVTALMVSVLALGCSDDDTPTTTVPVEEDHGIESMLDGVSSQVHQYLDSAVSVMEAGLEVAVFVDAGTDIGSIFMGSITPDSTHSGTWVVSWATDLVAGLGTMNIVDSLSYLVDGQLSGSAKDATAMYVKHLYTWDAADTTVSSNNLVFRGDLEVTGLDGLTATINGGFDVNAEEKVVNDGATSWDIWDVQITLDNLQMIRASGGVWDSGCPNSGSCTVLVEYTQAQNQDLPITTVWEYAVTFTDGEMDVDVSIGHLSTSYEETLCTP